MTVFSLRHLVRHLLLASAASMLPATGAAAADARTTPAASRSAAITRSTRAPAMCR
ncbi:MULTISPECIES: hypothetical protein [Burkholderia]|uniref:hypothetical protein n=1 Tax=Burkholderia TaxID=32008 RepID=UPI0012D2CDFC|nr:MULTISPECIES: hypothetical protein [Burkholderia]